MNRPSMGRRAPKGWAEQDTFTAWRRFYCYLSRAGATASIKRGARRRERHEARAAIARELDPRDLGNGGAHEICEHCAELHDAWECPEVDEEDRR